MVGGEGQRWEGWWWWGQVRRGGRRTSFAGEGGARLEVRNDFHQVVPLLARRIDLVELRPVGGKRPPLPIELEPVALHGVTWWRYLVALPGGVTWWRYLVALHGGVTWWRYMVASHGGITWWRYMAALHGGVTWRYLVLRMWRHIRRSPSLAASCSGESRFHVSPVPWAVFM